MPKIEFTWSMRDLAKCLYDRQQNKFDVIMIVDGPRGNGKSTFIYQLFRKMGKISGEKFRPRKDILFSRDDVMNALDDKRFGLIFADEMINAAHNRDFFSSDQKELIRMINMYRDHHNILAGAIPNFYDMDNQLRKLTTVRVTIIKRGLAVIQFAKTDAMFNSDVWHTKINEKIETGYFNRRKMGKKAKAPYPKLVNFSGYLKFGKLQKKSEELYQEIKDRKRREIRLLNTDDKKKPIVTVTNDLYEKLIERIKEQGMNRKSVMDYCILNGLKFSSVRHKLQQIIQDNGDTKPISWYWGKNEAADTTQNQYKKSFIPKTT